MAKKYKPVDRFKEYKQLFIDKQSNYSRLLDNSGSTPGELPHRLGKVRLDKTKLNKDNIVSKEKRTNYKDLDNIKDVLTRKYPKIYKGEK